MNLPPLWSSARGDSPLFRRDTLSAEEEAWGARLRGRSVLLVEDEVLIAMDIASTLEGGGVSVVGPFGHVAPTLEHLTADPRVDVAILDVRLGRESVFPVARHLQAKGVPFVFHTGHASRADLAATFPAAPVCLKPIPIDKLLLSAAALVPAPGDE
ncbi:MAG: response regulator [Myxococcota bacterium]